jgi:hypothetical protein
MQILLANNIPVNKLVCVSDGAPCMGDKHTGFIAYLENDETVPEFVHCHCLLHVQALCSRLKNAKETNECLDVVVKVIKYPTSIPLTKRFVKMFMNELVWNRNTRSLLSMLRRDWLIRGKALGRM